jgi:hypothetical protein
MKIALAFMTGVLAMAAVVYVTGARLATPMFFAGIVAVVAPGVAALSSINRVRSVARFLTAFADAWQGLKPITAVPEPVVDPLADDVASALVNQGVREKLANKIAAEAVKTNREFDPAYRAALALVPGSTRRVS